MFVVTRNDLLFAINPVKYIRWHEVGRLHRLEVLEIAEFYESTDPSMLGCYFDQPTFGMIQ